MCENTYAETWPNLEKGQLMNGPCSSPFYTLGEDCVALNPQEKFNLSCKNHNLPAITEKDSGKDPSFAARIQVLVILPHTKVQFCSLFSCYHSHYTAE